MSKREEIGSCLGLIDTWLDTINNANERHTREIRLHIKQALRPDFSDQGVEEEAIWVRVYLRKLPKTKGRDQAIEALSHLLDQETPAT